MKLDSLVSHKHTWTFNKNELIDMMLEQYQRQSSLIIKNVEKKNCRLYANNKETQHVQLTFFIEKEDGEDYNGKD